MILGLSMLTGVFSAMAQTNQPTDYSKIFKNDVEKNSYAIGMAFGGNIKQLLSFESNSVDANIVAKALIDTVNGSPTLITAEQEGEIMTALRMKVQTEQREQQRIKMKAEFETNSKAGAEFLAKNKNQPGVITLGNGLQYKILTAGTGEKPQATDMVTVNYRGTHLDGKEFDSSYKRGQPMVRAANQLIPGWTQALQMMPVGSKWELYIPTDLAYGERGAPPTIEPGETLIFEVELLSAKPAAASPQSMSSPSAPMTSDIIKVPSAEGLKHGEKIETIKAADVNKMGTNASN